MLVGQLDVLDEDVLCPEQEVLDVPKQVGGVQTGGPQVTQLVLQGGVVSLLLLLTVQEDEEDVLQVDLSLLLTVTHHLQTVHLQELQVDAQHSLLLSLPLLHSPLLEGDQQLHVLYPGLVLWGCFATLLQKLQE